MQQFLTVSLDLAFFALFAVTLIAYLRRRTPLSRDTTLVFASVAIVLALPLVRPIIPVDIYPTVSKAGTVAFLAQPFLTIRLIGHFRPGVRPIAIAVFVAFLAAAAASLLIPTAVPGQPRSDITILLTLGLVGYFVAVDVLAAALFAAEARRRAGAARPRLYLAALGTLLFGTAVLLLGAAATARVTETAGTINVATQIVALLAGLAYLVAFVPPPRLRRWWQRSHAYEYLRDLVAGPGDRSEDELWSRLADAARTLTGGRATAVYMGSADSTTAARCAASSGMPPESMAEDLTAEDLSGPVRAEGIGRDLDIRRPRLAPMATAISAIGITEMPIRISGGNDGSLLIFTIASPLFVEDDLALLEVLSTHTARAVQRQKVLAERTALVDELRRTNAELRHASTAKSDFLAAMSHELRTPLHAIIGFSELLLTPGPGETDPNAARTAEFAGHIHGAGLHLLELINDVLDLSKVEAGRLDLQYERFDLSALVHRTVRTMRPLAVRKQIELTIPEATGLEMEADAPRIRQIIFNLVSNAIKFTPNGGRVDVTLSAGTETARLTVADTGTGIPAEEQQAIFEPFHQADRGAEPRQEGTGLGLALTRQLVEGHGGRIELESAPGEGSRFSVVLPLARPRPAESARPVVPATDGATPPVAPADRPLVLVIEDDPRAAELAAVYLREAGYRVGLATDGEKGLEEARRERPAAILLDVILPGLDGWEILRLLKAQPDTSGIPVMVASVVDDTQLGFALGAVDYLVKPIQRDVLLNLLARVIAGNGNRKTPPPVLAIDDDADALDLYRAELEPEGYVCLGALSGAEGLRMATDMHPKAVLLDLLMPGMDGWEVARRLRADERTRDIPILVVTSHELTREDKTRLQGDVMAVLSKGPGAKVGLLEWLEQVTERPEHEPSAAR